MLVCKSCGTPILVAGHPCPSCGERGSIQARFYKGEIKPLPAAAPDDLATHQASRSGSLPDAQRAWSPWLAGALSFVVGPVGGAFVAARNLTRLNGDKDPWTVAFGVLCGQLLIAVGAGFLARSSVAGAWGLWAVYTLLVAVFLIRWQWAPVARQRAAVAGRHTPGADAFAAFLLALCLGLASQFVGLRVADKLSDGQFGRPLAQLKPHPRTPPPPMMGFPGM